MTTYLDYKVLPADNNGPPPVGAPEQHPTSQVNNIMREMMSVVRQLGDSWQASVDALGTMASQDADAVAITGGTITADLSGPGGGITNLKAQNLIEGPIPKTIFPADATPLDVKVARAAQADALTAAGITAMFPIGTIILWYGAEGSVPAGWHICDGTSGTPDLRSRMVLGAGPANALGTTGGAWSSGAATDAQGAHSHGGGTAGVALTIAQMPAHDHVMQVGNVGTGGPYGRLMDPGPALVNSSNPVSVTGGGAAHAHGIGADGSHAHNVTVSTIPVYTAIYYIMRIT